MSVLSAPEGSFWEDPPGYWDDIVWPAYVKAHQDMFENRDYAKGKPISMDEEKAPPDFHAGKPTDKKATSGVPTLGEENVEQDATRAEQPRCGGPVPRLEVLQAEEMSMEDVVNEACRRLDAYLSGIIE
jgi:hypothetical protein